MGWSQERAPGEDCMKEDKSRNVCVGSRPGLRSICKNLCLSVKRKSSYVDNGEGLVFFLRKRMYIPAKKNVWQAIPQNMNGGCLWVLYYEWLVFV